MPKQCLWNVEKCNHCIVNRVQNEKKNNTILNEKTWIEKVTVNGLIYKTNVVNKECLLLDI